MAIEVLRGQQGAQLVDIATPPVDPPPERNRLRFYARPQPVPKQSDECHAAGAGLVEVRGLGCTRIHGRNRRSRGDVTERMRVTYREIIQPTLDARIATNREVRLIAVHVERGAMDAPDAYPRVTGFACRKRHREVVLSCLRSARARIENYVRRKFMREVVTVNDMHPRRKLRSKRMTRSPHRLGRKRIVIARDQENGRMGAG